MGNTGATEALQNPEQSPWAPSCSQTAAPLSSPLVRSLALLSPFFLTFLYRSVALSGIFLSLSLCIPVFLSLCHSIAPLCPPTSLAAPPHPSLLKDAVSAALADLDVMELQVCQHRVCVCVEDGAKSEEKDVLNK